MDRKNPKISDEFFKNNLEVFIYGVKKRAEQMVRIYNCEWMKQNLIDAGIRAIEEHGEIEKNFAFDKERAITKLLYKAKFAMLDEMIKEYKITSFINGENSNYIKYEERESNITDWLKPIKFKLIHILIIYQMQINIYEILANRREGMKQICSNLKITRKTLYDNINEIKKLLIRFNKVKICKNGKVIIRYER